MAELENIIGSIMSSPESLGRIMDIVSLLGGEEKSEEVSQKEEPKTFELGNIANGLDPELITKLMGLLNEYNADDDRRIRLLYAMRPYVKDSDSLHIDRAVRIVKLARVAKGALESFLK